MLWDGMGLTTMVLRGYLFKSVQFACFILLYSLVFNLVMMIWGGGSVFLISNLCYVRYFVDRDGGPN